MDTIIQAATVIAAFAAMHERMLELLQQAGRRLKWWSLEYESRIDRWSILLAFLLAVITHANLIELFVKTQDGTTSQFFKHYLAWPTAWSDWHQDAPGVNGGVLGRVFQEIAGFAIMALSTAFGSKFWHDLVKGLTDLRERAHATQRASEPLPMPPLPPEVPENKDSVSRPGPGRLEPLAPPMNAPPTVTAI